jgi:hypothetical protein
MSDGMPRIIARQNSMYVVTPKGSVWQVLDADTRSCIGGGVPRNDPDVLARIFVGTEDGNPIRIYRFGIGESRAVTAWGILEQLERALRGDDRAA